MADCHEDGSVCASLPVNVRSLMLVHCEVHQSYTLHVSRYREAGGEPEVTGQGRVTFGPFDDWYTIESGVRQALEDLLR